MKKQTENGQVNIQTPETELTPEERIAELEIEIAELKDKYIRSMAEFENFRNRSNREKADWIKLSTQKLALKVCDVLDNLERALEQVDEEAKEDKLIKGFVLIEQQLRKVLESENVRNPTSNNAYAPDRRRTPRRSDPRDAAAFGADG